MKRVVHLSDLHFGHTDKAVVEALAQDIILQRPDLVVVSGDLTQRARSWQFAEAKAFLARLPAPCLVVPGNHDLAPLYNPIKRLLAPRDKFHLHLPDHGPWPVWEEEELVAVGLDSTRSLRWKSGKLRSSHLVRVEQVLARAPLESCKLAFLHHPPRSAGSGHPFDELARRGIDLVLSGHVHHAHVEIIVETGGGTSILVQSSTACSTRLREDANGYSLIAIAMPALEVEVRGWDGEGFHAVSRHAFVKAKGRWTAS